MAQNASITGTVTDAATGKRIAGANVFISNTSKGTVSDANGAFVLREIPPGKYDLIISITGYETIAYPFNSDKLPLKLDVQMNLKVKQWETANVTPFEKDGWQKWGKLFTESFLGLTPNAANCKLLNKEAIRFRYNKKEGILEAVADTLLLIENNALGYFIRYQLEAFEYNFKQRSVIYGGYPLFEAMQTERKGKQKRYASARRKAYYGSTIHFMRSLFRNQLPAEGFEVRTSQKIPNTEKQRIKKIYGFYNGKISGSIQISGGNHRSAPEDSSNYFERIMNQPDFFELIGRELLGADSLLSPGLLPDYQLFGFPYQLLVIYKNEKPAIEYQHTQGFNAPPQQTTRLFFVDDNSRQLHVYSNGSYFNPLELYLDGYMGWEKMAELLPLEYQPDEK
jgi:CarboxypepD_reg-like domain